MAFQTYNIVEDSTGAILHQLGLDIEVDPNAVTDNTPVGTTAFLGDPLDRAETTYYVGSVKTPRPDFMSVASISTTSFVANGTDSVSVGPGLPNPTEILVEVPMNKGLNIPGPIMETSGTFSLTTVVSGDYYITLKAFPFLEGTYKVTAT